MEHDDLSLKDLLGEDYEDFLVFKNTKWIGPFTIDQMLDSCLVDSLPKPPESHSIYVISKLPWTKRPSIECLPLYVGSTTGRSPRFRTRIGDVIVDMFGFFQWDSGHSSGGISLHNYCKRNSLSPKKLYIGWLEKCGCTRCAEYYFWRDLQPELNRNRPPVCQQHKGKDKYLSIIP